MFGYGFMFLRLREKSERGDFCPPRLLPPRDFCPRRGGERENEACARSLARDASPILLGAALLALGPTQRALRAHGRSV